MIPFLNRNNEKRPHTHQIKIAGRNHILQPRLGRFFGIPKNTAVFQFCQSPSTEKPKKMEKDEEPGKNEIKMLMFQLILAENL